MVNQSNDSCVKICSKATAPINIPLTCNETCGSGSRCSYTYDYSITDLKVTNKGNYLSIVETNAPTSKAAATYNSTSYIVNEIRLYTPSLHKYDGDSADAEMIIVHDQLIAGVAQTTASPLLVCLPIQSGAGGQIPGASTLNNILNTAADSIPTKGKITTIPSSSTEFSLNNFIPKEGFYVYSGSLPYTTSTSNNSADVPSCSYNDVQYIVFNKNINFFITTKSLSSLKKVINDSNFCVNSKMKCSGGGGLIFNTYPPKLSSASDDIYIDCQPVNSSGQTMVEEPPKSATVWGATLLDKLMNSGIISMFFGFFFMIFLYHMSKKFFRSIGVTKDSPATDKAGADEHLANKITKRRSQRDKAVERMKIKPDKPTMQRIKDSASRTGKRIGSAKRRILTGVDVKD